MSRYDILSAAIMLIAGFLGWKLGVIRLAMAAAAPMAAGALVPFAYVNVISRISFFSSNPYLGVPSAWALALTALWIAAAVITKIADALMIGFVNRILGAAVFAAAALWALSLFSGRLPSMYERMKHSAESARLLRVSDVFHKK